MPLERAARPQVSPASVERLADALFDLAGEQDVRVIEALAAVFARRWRDAFRSPPGGLSEAISAYETAHQASDAAADRRRAICRRIARRALRGSLVDPTQGATAAHHIDVSPSWSRGLLPIGMFGPFLFYRGTPARSRASDRPGAHGPQQPEIADFDW